MEIARRNKLKVVEDACQAVGAKLHGKYVGSFGDTAAFSWHPLKPLNVWGDGGAVVTQDDKLDDWMRLYRNHGLRGRDEIEFWGVNTRLQSFQAVVALHILREVPWNVDRRNEILRRLDAGIGDIPEIKLPPRSPEAVPAGQIYVIRAQRRDELMRYLIGEGIEAKVHYPIPLHLQKAARDLGYKRGDFPACEAQADEILTLPAHQHLTDEEVDYTVDRVRRFYKR